MQKTTIISTGTIWEAFQLSVAVWVDGSSLLLGGGFMGQELCPKETEQCLIFM